MKTKQKGFAGVAALVAVVVAIIAGGAYVMIRQNNLRNLDNLEAQPPSEQSATPTSNTSSNPSSLNFAKTKSVSVTQVYDATQNLKADGVTTTSQLHVTVPVTTTVDCGDQNCFNEKFAECKPSTLNSDIDFAAASYKIIGPVSGGCQMVFKYTKNPNPAWVNKEMTCTYDNKLPFQESFEKTFDGVMSKTTKCTGPLYEILTSI